MDGLLLAGSRGIAAEMNVGQAYTVKHIRKGLTLLNYFVKMIVIAGQ